MEQGDCVVGISEETNPHFWKIITDKAGKLRIGDKNFFAVIESFGEAQVPVFNQEECLARAEECEKAPNPLILAGMTANEAILRSNVNLATHYVLSGKTDGGRAVIDEFHRFVSYFLI